MKKNIVYAFIVVLALLLSACGSNDKSDRSLKDLGSTIFTAEAGSMTINNLNFKTSIPFTKLENKDVGIEFSNFNLSLNGCEIDGPVTYSPSLLSLDGAKGSQKSITVSGTVKNDCTVTGYQLKADKKVSLEGKNETTRAVNIINVTLDANGNPIGSSNPTNPTVPVVDGNFSFFNIPSAIVISKASEKYSIKLQLIDKALKGVPGKEIEILAYDVNFGKVEAQKVTTDANGFANFLYTSPNDLTPINGQTLPLTIVFDDNGTRIDSTNITLSFNVTGTTPGAYQFINAKGVIVKEAASTQEITVDLVDGQNNGVAGKEIKITTPPLDFGSIEPSIATTNSAGRAVFTYTAPKDLSKENGNSTNVTFSFSDENGNAIAPATASIEIDTDVVVPTFLYSFINASDITITHGNQKEDVKVQLTFKGVPIADKTVKMKAFDAKKGTIGNSYTIITDNAGYATFFYIAPNVIDDLNGTILKLIMQFDEGVNHIEQNATIRFNKTTDSVEGNVSLPIVVIPTNQREIILDSNSKTIEIAIKVFKDISPYSQGSVKVELPNKVLNGVDVGLFASYIVPVNAQGIATFSYTGPSNLQALIVSGDKESIFKFYHIENSENKQEMKVTYNLPPDPHISRNYELDIVTSGDFSMGIPEKEKTFNVLLKAKDSAGNDVILTSENITKITALTTNSTIAEILNTATGNLVNSLELNTANNSPFILKSKKLSGLVPVKVTVEFTDANGAAQVISTIVNVRVFSGPPSAISISYVSTGQDAGKAKYIEKLAISATDEYGNKVNTRPNITLGAIVGYAVDGSNVNNIETKSSRRLFYGKDNIDAGNANGTIDALNDADVHTSNFEDITPARIDVFKYVNAEGNNTDKLVVFGVRKAYEAMGKWDITLAGDNHTLTLEDNYFGVDRSGLSYAVGHNYYQDQCRQDGREWIGSTDSDTYKLDEEGTVVIDYKYDYHLGGKDALIWVNLDGIQPDTGKITRIGEASKAPLRTTGLTKAPKNGYKLAKGTSGTGTFIIWHENAPERYRNAHFSYRVKFGSTCGYKEIATSNHFDARTCDNREHIITDTDNNISTPPVDLGVFGELDGTSYVSFYLTAPDDQDCTFDLENIIVSQEF